MKFFKVQSLGFLLVTALFLNTACTREDAGPAPLPQGVQVLTGTLLRTDLSLIRRGTHVLRIASKDAYYVESSQVNLRRYEGKEIVIEGTLEQNTEPTDLPVLITSDVLQVIQEEWKKWDLPSVGLSLETPDDWRGIDRNGRAGFRVPEWADPVFSIDKEEEVDTTGGTPMVLDSKRAMQLHSEDTGEQRVILEWNEDAYLVFSFTPGAHPDADTLREDWLAILQSVRFTDAKSPDTPRTSSGATRSDGLGQPCGGPAGVLCPAGLYCDIENLEENIGVCKQL